MNLKSMLICSAAALATASFLSTDAQAQEQTEQSAAQQNPSASDSRDIIVTARRRDESIVNVPVSVTVASGEQLRSANITNMAEIGRIAPAVRTYPVQGRSTTTSFVIRGQVETSGLPTTDPAVGIYFADAVQTRPQGSGKLFYDLASIQVVSGLL